MPKHIPPFLLQTSSDTALPVKNKPPVSYKQETEGRSLFIRNRNLPPSEQSERNTKIYPATMIFHQAFADSAAGASAAAPASTTVSSFASTSEKSSLPVSIRILYH